MSINYFPSSVTEEIQTKSSSFIFPDTFNEISKMSKRIRLVHYSILTRVLRGGPGCMNEQFLYAMQLRGIIFYIDRPVLSGIHKVSLIKKK